MWIKNWRKYQHYKHRNPPWIKLHYQIFTSSDWVLLDDASKLLAVVCMLIASKHNGEIPTSCSAAYFKRIAYLDKLPNFKPLIESGFLVETLAGASESKQLRTNADREYRAQSPDTEINTELERGVQGGKQINGHGDRKRDKPPHGIKTKDGKRVWLDRETSDFRVYAVDYERAHGAPIKLLWNNSGAWFNLSGEK